MSHFTIRRMISLLLSAVLLLMSCSAIAEELDAPASDPEAPAYQAIAQFMASLSISGGNAKCIGRVTMKAGHTGTLTVTLQQKQGSTWVNVTSWSGTVPTGSIKKVEGNYSLSTSGTYRVRANFVSSDGNEDEDTYSRTATY